MADIFISYAREDREWVSTLAAAVQADGYTVWWDWDLLVGKRYRETIEAELQTCKATLVVWSQHSIHSDFVRDEAEEGQQRNVLLPVLKEAVRPPAGFRQLQTADLTTWTGDTAHAEYRRMMKGLTALVGREPARQPGDPAPVVSEPVTAAPAPPTPETPIVAPPIPPEPIAPVVAPAVPTAAPPAPPEPVVLASASAHTPVVDETAIAAPRSNRVAIFGVLGAVVVVALLYVVWLLIPHEAPKPIVVPPVATPTTPAAHPGGGTANGGAPTTPSGPPSNGTTPDGGDTGGQPDASGDEAGNAHGASQSAPTPPSTPPSDDNGSSQDEGQTH